MIGTFNALVSAVKGLRGVAQQLEEQQADAKVALKTREINERIGDVMEKLLTAQLDYSSLIDGKRELETQIAKLNQWTLEQQRYQLQKTEAGALIYICKPEQEHGQPSHHICTKCYEEQIKAILQPGPIVDIYETLLCHRCNSSYRTKRISMEVRTVGRGMVSKFDGF